MTMRKHSGSIVDRYCEFHDCQYYETQNTEPTDDGRLRILSLLRDGNCAVDKGITCCLFTF